MSSAGQVDVLSLVAATRAGGASQSERHFLDFKIGRRRLSALIKQTGLVSTLGWLAAKTERSYARQLLLREPSVLKSGRVPLYICAECADLGCGVIAVRVTRDGEHMVWTELCQDCNLPSLEPVDGVMPVESWWPMPAEYRFDRAAYVDVFGRFAGR